MRFILSFRQPENYIQMSNPSKKNRSKTSQAWLNEHINDPFVHLAQKEGYRARAAYKLLEINEKYNLLRPNITIVDLGSAPGSWSQVVARKLGKSATIFALDILPMDEIDGVTFIQGDFREETVLQQLGNAVGEKAVDLVISDIAPNMSGNTVTDQAKSFYLSDLALDFARNHLKDGGDFLIKVFQGAGFNEYMQALKSSFAKTLSVKPKASRGRSNEIYLLARGYHR